MQISLALKLHADVLLIDEAAGRHEAKARHIQVAGTLTFPEELERLHELRFRASASVENEVLGRYEASMKRS